MNNKTIRQMINKYKTINDFLKNESLKVKMEIAYYFNTGKSEVITTEYFSALNKAVHDDIFMISKILQDYVGIDTRGLIQMIPGLGRDLNIFKLEDKIDDVIKLNVNKEEIK